MSYALGITLSHKQKVLVNGIPKEFEKLREFTLRLNAEKMRQVFGASFDAIHSKLNLSSIEKGIIILGVKVIAAAEGPNTKILAITDIYYEARHFDPLTLAGAQPVRITLDPNGPKERREKGAAPPSDIGKALGHIMRSQNLFATKSVYDEGIYKEEDTAPSRPSNNGSADSGNNGSSQNGSNGNVKN